MIHHFPGVDEAEFPQVFPLDAPRIGELATALADDEGEVVKAAQAGFAYQLGTAAELTDGTLPVFVIKQGSLYRKTPPYRGCFILYIK